MRSFSSPLSPEDGLGMSITRGWGYLPDVGEGGSAFVIGRRAN